MNLLYCKNGIVIGWHDSEAGSVPASAYGDGVRVIPYEQLISTLPRMGDPPADPRLDPRPYQQPLETPAILIAFAGQLRWDNVTSGCTFVGDLGTTTVKTDRASQALISNLAQYAGTLNPNAIVDFTQSGVAYQITAKDAINLNAAVNAQIQKYRTVEAQCIADLNSSTPTIATYEDVEARFAAARGAA